MWMDLTFTVPGRQQVWEVQVMAVLVLVAAGWLVGCARRGRRAEDYILSSSSLLGSLGARSSQSNYTGRRRPAE